MRAAGGQSGSQPGGSAGSAAEKPQLSYPRHLLGVRQSAPSVVVLAERGERPLWQRWLRRAAKLWNRTLAEQPGGRMLQALHSSIHLAATPQTPARQSWAAQLAAGLAVGIQLDMQQPAPVDLGELGPAAPAGWSTMCTTWWAPSTWHSPCLGSARPTGTWYSLCFPVLHHSLHSVCQPTHCQPSACQLTCFACCHSSPTQFDWCAALANIRSVNTLKQVGCDSAVQENIVLLGGNFEKGGGGSQPADTQLQTYEYERGRWLEGCSSWEAAASVDCKIRHLKRNIRGSFCVAETHYAVTGDTRDQRASTIGRGGRMRLAGQKKQGMRRGGAVDASNKVASAASPQMHQLYGDSRASAEESECTP